MVQPRIGMGGGVIDLINWKLGLNGSGAAAIQWMREQRHLPEDDGSRRPRPSIVADLRLRRRNRRTSFQVCRWQPKAFRQRRRATGHDPADRSMMAGSVRSRVAAGPLSGCPNCMRRSACERTVFIPRARRDVDNCWQRGIPATTNAMGAGKWPRELNDYFRGADVVSSRTTTSPATST